MIRLAFMFTFPLTTKRACFTIMYICVTDQTRQPGVLRKIVLLHINPILYNSDIHKRMICFYFMIFAFILDYFGQFKHYFISTFYEDY